MCFCFVLGYVCELFSELVFGLVNWFGIYVFTDVNLYLFLIL